MNIIVNDISSNISINDIEKKKQIEKNKKSDSCQELKNIAYKTMLLNGTNIIPTIAENNKSKISSYLESELKNNKSETWIKLDKTQKIKRLNIYADTLVEQYNLTEKELNGLKDYFIKCLERKNLLRTKEVSYNNEENIIENIPYLIFSEENRRFILKKDDKHVSTVKSLPSEKKGKAKTIKIHELE